MSEKLKWVCIVILAIFMLYLGNQVKTLESWIDAEKIAIKHHSKLIETLEWNTRKQWDKIFGDIEEMEAEQKWREGMMETNELIRKKVNELIMKENERAARVSEEKRKMEVIIQDN